MDVLRFKVTWGLYMVDFRVLDALFDDTGTACTFGDLRVLALWLFFGAGEELQLGDGIWFFNNVVLGRHR
jgi:hypothetical protein